MSGLAWRKKRLGEPKGGIKLENEKLAEALIEKHTTQSSDQDEVVFTETEWKALDLTTEIHEEHFIRTEDWCFQPTGTAVTFRKTTCESSAWRLLLPSDLDHRAGGRISMLRSWYATSLLLLPFACSLWTWPRPEFAGTTNTCSTNGTWCLSRPSWSRRPHFAYRMCIAVLSAGSNLAHNVPRLCSTRPWILRLGPLSNQAS